MQDSTRRNKLLGLFALALTCLAMAEEVPVVGRQSAPEAALHPQAQGPAGLVAAVAQLASSEGRALPPLRWAANGLRSQSIRVR